LRQAVRQDEERWRQRLNDPRIDFQELNRDHQIVDTALQRLISRDLVDLETNRLRLALGDQTMDEMIRSSDQFKNERGEFDAKIYQQYAAAQGKSPQQFKAAVRDDVIRLQLSQAVMAGSSPPSELVEQLYRARAERRTAEVGALAPGAVADPGTPGADELKAYYERHRDDFAVPPLVSFTAALLRVDDVAATIEVPEDRLREEYQSRLSEFREPQETHFDQMVLPSEDKAKAGAAALAEGKDFAQVASEMAQAKPTELDIGTFKKGDLLPAALNDAAFALKAGETTPPIQTAFGWHILRAVEVKPERVQPFEAVKEKLAKDAAREMAGDRIAKLERGIEDATANGRSLADIAQRFDMKLVKVEGVDKNGDDRAGKQVDLPAASGDMLEKAFAAGTGKLTAVEQLADDAGDYVLQVDALTEKAWKPLDEVKAQAVTQWQEEKRQAALAALAAAVAAEVKDGKTLAEVAALRKLATVTVGPLTRTARDGKASPALVAALFNAKPGAAVTARGDDGYLVAEVKEVLPPDPAQKDKEMAAVSESFVAPTMREDLLEQFDQALRRRFPVSVDEAAVARAF